MRNLKYLLAVAGLAGILAVGCTNDTKDPGKPVGNTAANDDAHDDQHVHGKMGGEIFDIEGMDLKLECVAKYRDNLITFFLWDKEGKTAKKVKCEEMQGSYTAGEVKSVTIAAVDTEDGMSSRFEVEDEGFAIARKTTGVKIEFEIDGTRHTIDIPKDPHG